MDGKSFDSWTKTRAAATNRRTILGWSLTAGVATALGRTLPASAQFGNGGGSCTYQITLTSLLSAGATVSGTLVIDIGDDGAIDNGSLTLSGQAPASVVGQATGPAIDLLASLADGTTLSLTGVADKAIAQCNAAILGSLANSGNGQIGIWKTDSISGSGSGSSTSAPPPSTGESSSGTSSGGGSGSGGGSDSGGGSGSDGGNGAGGCLELQSQCNASAECCSGWCTDNECRSCSDTICGEDCIVLSDNLAHCGQCFNACDVETQSCVNGTCTNDNAGDGGGDQPVACEGINPADCPGYGCVDLFSDPNNCGACYVPCVTTGRCIAGLCA